MDYKLDYISRIFKKTSKKRTENYILTRIWHQLNNINIKICHQQYVNRGDGKYALTDIFFPQFDYHIEVNEDFHYKDNLKKELDFIRANDIKTSTKDHIIRFIDCRGNLEQIHSQVDKVIEEINSIYLEQKTKGYFKPWDGNELKPEYWLNKNTLKVSDNINLRTIDDIGTLFNVEIKKRGFLKPGAVKYPKEGYTEIWWPEKKKKNNWVNDFYEDFKYITEEHIDDEKSISHLNYFIKKSPNCKRVVFFKYKDELGFNFYKFVGCYEFSIEISKKQNKVIWKRFSESIDDFRIKKPVHNNV